MKKIYICRDDRTEMLSAMEELKEALAWNYGKGLDEQSVRDITTGILREMTESGAKVDADTAAAVLRICRSCIIRKESAGGGTPDTGSYGRADL